ncbi:MAG: hypothetical protein FJY91_02730 [Candidatus Harrisonbacteria bacterium]|nr:hypothetical protein [Candidatus Harrisonbacteria bacterium]
MLEYAVKGLVLSRNPIGELDNLYNIYTDKLGLISVRGGSTRKITSKLNSHLDPLNLVFLRIVRKNYFRVVDALISDPTPGAKSEANRDYNLNIIESLLRLLESEIPDSDLFLLLESGLKAGRIRGTDILSHLGLDPAFSACPECGKPPIGYFLAPDAFLCRDCAKKFLHTSVWQKSFIPL